MNSTAPGIRLRTRATAARAMARISGENFATAAAQCCAGVIAADYRSVLGDSDLLARRQFDIVGIGEVDELEWRVRQRPIGATLANRVHRRTGRRHIDHRAVA